VGTSSSGRVHRHVHADDVQTLVIPGIGHWLAGAGRVVTGKVAVITGAAEGIGAGLVAGYRGRGWSVMASATILRPPNDPEVPAVEGDIADPAGADRVIDAALARFGRLDTLVNNAGIIISKPFTDNTAADYTHVVNVPVAVAGSAGSGTPGVLTALTEGGLAAATRSLAVEYASFGVRVNAVSPGIIGAPAQVSDIVDGVLFLESSPYITGEILHIAGARRT
jgi:NAD(P)-dependent dehydrogenase (short-subunit alcohol dehydrogenase family)